MRLAEIFIRRPVLASMVSLALVLLGAIGRTGCARQGCACKSCCPCRVHLARYREGATTMLDLLEAQVGLSEAETELVQAARYAARLALVHIETLGRCSENR